MAITVIDYKVKSLNIKRNNNNFEASWSIPSGATQEAKDKKKDTRKRWNGVFVTWHYRCVGENDWRLLKAKESQGISNTKDTVSKSTIVNKAPTDVAALKVTVVGRYDKTEAPHHNTDNYQFDKPNNPTCSLSVNEETGRVTVTGKVEDKHDKHDFQTLFVSIERKDNFNSQYKEWTVVEGDARNSTEYSQHYDVRDWQAISKSQWIAIRGKVIANGINGFANKVATKDHEFAYPKAATLSYKIVNTSKATSLIYFTYKHANTAKFNSAKRPTQIAILQRLRDSTTKNENDVMYVDDGNWEEVQKDNGSETGFTDFIGNARSAKGRHTWYRVKLQNDNLINYSNPVRIKELYRDPTSVTGDLAGIISATPNSDGESINTVIGWNDDDSLGTEISWADKQDAWTSTEPPSTYEVLWETVDTMAAEKAAYSAALSSGRVILYSSCTMEDGYQFYYTPPWTGIYDILYMVSEDNHVIKFTAQLNDDNMILKWKPSSEVIYITYSDDSTQVETIKGTVFNLSDINGSGWDNTAELVIRGLSEGTTYYIKARRFKEDDESESMDYIYGAYLDVVTATPRIAPTKVVILDIFCRIRSNSMGSPFRRVQQWNPIRRRRRGYCRLRHRCLWRLCHSMVYAFS